MPSTPARRIRLAIVLLLAATLAGTTLSTASADDKGELKDKRSEVSGDINQAQSSLDESSKRLVRADNAYDAARDQLDDARTTLATTQGQLQAAKAYDEQMQAKLADAQDELKVAKTELADGKARVGDAMDKAQQFLIDQAVEGDPNLRAFSSLMRGEDSSSYGVRMDYTSAVNDAQTATLDGVEASKVMLELRRDRVREARDAVAEQRKEAAENLVLRKKLEQQAEAEEVQVEGLVDTTGDARAEADEAKQADLQQLDELENERGRIQGMLQQIAARERRQEAREEAQESGGTPSGGGTPNTGSPNTGSTSDAGFDLQYPVANTYITSPYGMRMHPILHVYKLHDGTDFHADCGTPVMASEDGTVTSAYYNAGYGNRIIISHGIHNGVSVATSYNHMTSFSVSVGQSVSQGEIIGYSGTTGYSTACHMHFMVYVNGATVDPMTWL